MFLTHKNRVKKEKIIWLTELLLYLSLYLPVNVIPFVAMVIMLRAMMNSNKFPIEWSSFFGYMLLFAGFCALSTIWALDKNLAINKSIDLFKGTIIIFVLFQCEKDKENAESMLKIVMWGGYLVILYSIATLGVTGFLSMMRTDSSRFGTEINSNTIGMCAAYSFVIGLYLWRKNGFTVSNLFLVLCILSVGLSASRKGLIILVGGTLGMLVMERKKNSINVNRLLKGVLILFGVVFFLYILIKLGVFSNLGRRMDLLIDSVINGNKANSISIKLRDMYLKLGKELFLQHPIYGIGIDNARIFVARQFGTARYLHNNFIELLADVGVIGFAIYYSIHVYLLGCFFREKRYSNSFTSEDNLCLILLCLITVLGYGYVCYARSSVYFMLMMCYTVIKRHERINQRCRLPARDY